MRQGRDVRTHTWKGINSVLVPTRVWAELREVRAGDLRGVRTRQREGGIDRPDDAAAAIAPAGG